VVSRAIPRSQCSSSASRSEAKHRKLVTIVQIAFRHSFARSRLRLWRSTRRSRD
jgi:hypothetical protein